MQVLVNYHGNPPLNKLAIGDWIDLRAAEEVSLKAGECRRISLGISMKLPAGYEAHIAPRSSTFDKWGIMLTNGIGIIDNSYSGDDDIWLFSALAMRDTVIHKGDRIAQFRVMPKQPNLELISVDHLDGPNRGGFGSSGHN